MNKTFLKYMNIYDFIERFKFKFENKDVIFYFLLFNQCINNKI